MSSLDLWDTFKLSDLHANLYITKCDIMYRQRHRRGEGRPFVEKLSIGFGIFCVLIAILFGPLLFFSSANPVTQINEVQFASVQLTLQGPRGEYELMTISSTQSIAFASSHDYHALRAEHALDEQEDMQQVQKITMSSFADRNWDISPPALKSLSRELRDPDVRMWGHYYYKFTRSGPESNKKIEGLSVIELDEPTQLILAEMIQSNDSSQTATIKTVAPTRLRLPGFGEIKEILGKQNRSTIQVQLRTENSLMIPGQSSDTSRRFWTVEMGDEATAPFFIAISERIWAGALSGFSYSIIAVYFTV